MTSKEGWMKLFRDFMSEIIRETPVNILKVCGTITYDVQPLELFNACFVSIWNKLEEQLREKLVDFLELALNNSNLPEIIKIILNLDDFIERCNIGGDAQSFPLNLQLLSQKAIEVNDYARALRYLEEQFRAAIQFLKFNNLLSGISIDYTLICGSLNDRKSRRFKGCNLNEMSLDRRQVYMIELVEQLVTLNYELQQHQAAMGILDFVGKYLEHLEAKTKVKWFEKLHEWKKALSIYERKLTSIHPTLVYMSPNDPSRFLVENAHELSDSKLDILMGRMRCLKVFI
jgi:serine/threonine-protein kinase mTOR